MTPSGVVIKRLVPGEAAIDTFARWRHDAFLKSYGLSLEESHAHLVRLAEAPPGELALVAWLGDEPCGICLLVREELDAPHALSPWLASLFVTEAHRGKGVGRDLVAAIEVKGRSMGYGRLHLYTDGAERFYIACGWWVKERFDWGGAPAVLMVRDLSMIE